jgi:hypothetical protein
MAFTKALFVAAALTASFLIPIESSAQPAAAAKNAVAKVAPKTAPTAAEIADAKAKGLVWANLNTKVYHKTGRFYGSTKNGKFMTEADAQKAGYKAAQEAGAAKKKANAKNTAKK